MNDNFHPILVPLLLGSQVSGSAVSWTVRALASLLPALRGSACSPCRLLWAAAWDRHTAHTGGGVYADVASAPARHQLLRTSRDIHTEGGCWVAPGCSYRSHEVVHS